MSYSDHKENVDYGYGPEHIRLSSSNQRRSSQQTNRSSNSNYSYDPYSQYSKPESHPLRNHRQSYNRGSKESFEGKMKEFAGGSNYHHNKRVSRTKEAEYNERSSNNSHRQSGNKHQDRLQASQSTGSNVDEHTIAVFGAYGKTGHYFLQLAMEAGYNVRVLLLPGVELDMPESDNLRVITGTFDEERKIQRVISKAAYIVCMLNDCKDIVDGGESMHASNFEFIQRLVLTLEQSRSPRVLLYQASSYAIDNNGSAPVLSNIVKKMAITKISRDAFNEEDRIVKYISTQLDTDICKYIITRPGDLIWDKPSKKKLAASKSQPPPFPITNIDLAEFSLNALKAEKLYNTCPYIVQDY